MTQRSRLWLCAASALVVGSLSYGAISRAREELATILPGPITRSIIARAALVPIDGISKIRARLDGLVTRVHVREGDVVKAGQLLAEVEAQDLSLRVERARAEVSVLVALLDGVRRGDQPNAKRELSALTSAADRELVLAKQNAERAATLRISGSISEVAAQEAQAGADIAQARLAASQARLDGRARGSASEVNAAGHRLEAARAELSAMEVELLRTQVVAPADGMVLTRRVNPGDVLRVLDGQVLFELANPAQVELRGEVEELQAALVRVGAGAEITAPGGLTRLGRGRVVRVAPGVSSRLIAGDPSELRADSLVRAVYIALEPGNLLDLPLGQRVEARIVLETERVAARAPRAAVRLENGRASVLVQEGMLRQQRMVELGVADDQNVQVRGLPLGTRVVVSARN